MAKQINQYTKTRTKATIQLQDLMDFDSTDDNGLTFESAKVTVEEFRKYLSDFVPTLYNADGQIDGIRTIGMNGFAAIWENGTINIKGSGSTSATTSLLVEDSLGNDLFTIKDDGEIKYLDRELFTYDSGNGRLWTGQGFTQLNLNPTNLVNCNKPFHVTTINSLGGGSATQISIGSNNISYKGSNISPSGLNHYFNTNTNVADASNSILSVANFGVRLFDVKSDGKVGIGTSTPTENLDVVGNINASGTYNVGGVAGFTGTGTYTNFTIVGGIITAAS